MIKMKMKLLAVFIILLLSQTNSIYSDNSTIDFSFQTTDSEEKSIRDFYDKPLVIEWAASWCNACKKNQEAINEIYLDFIDDINFVSISVSISEDTIDDVKRMKQNRNYNWTFGLDINRVSIKYQVFNGYTWLVDTSGQILERWNGTLISAEILIESFERNLQITNGKYSSESNMSHSSLISFSTIFILSIIWRKSR